MSADPLLEKFTTTDGYTLGVRRYRSSGTVRARIVCVHGIRSHGGWYDRTCQSLAQAGYEVVFPDRRGAGMNQNQRGDAPGPRRIIDDVAELIRHEQKELPGLKTILAGISWGGKTAAALPYRAPGLIDGLALVSPGFCPLVSLPFRARMQILRQRFSNPLQQISIPLNEPELFTNLPEGQRFVREDKLGLTQATARFVFVSRQLDYYLRRATKHIRVPLLLQLSGQDRVIDCAKTKEYVIRFPSPDIRILEYPDAGHTFEFETETHPWLKDLLAWLELVTG